MSGKRLNFGLDYDGTMTPHGREEIELTLADVLKRNIGRCIHLTLATGRFAGQMGVIGGSDFEAIMQANLAFNPKNIHVFEGGGSISDAEGNIYYHDRNKLEVDQIEAVSDLVLVLRSLSAEPLLVFQNAEKGVKKKTRWVNGQINAFYSNPVQITPIRNRMYTVKEEIPSDRTALINRMIQSNPSKIIIVSEALQTVGGPTFAQIKDELQPMGLDLTGNAKSGMDIVRAGIDKVSGLKIAFGLLGIPQLDYYAGDSLGEYGNDYAVFTDTRITENGIAVVNLHEYDMSFAKIPFKVVKGAEGLAEYIQQLTTEA